MTKSAEGSRSKPEVVATFEGRREKVIGAVVNLLFHVQKAQVLEIQSIELQDGAEDQLSVTVEGGLDPTIHFIGGLLGMRPDAQIQDVQPYQIDE